MENTYMNNQAQANSGQKNTGEKIAMIIGSAVIGIILLAGATFASYLLVFGGQEVIEVEKYVSVYDTGVEGQVALEIYVDEYALEDDYSYKEAEDALNFLEGIEYSYNGKVIPSSYDVQSPIFDLKQNDEIDIKLEYDAALAKRYKFKTDVKSFQYEIIGLDVIVKDIASISGEALSEHFSDLKEYGDAEGEALEALEYGEHISTFYKIEDNYDIERDLTTTGTSGFTLLHAFLYQGKVYLAGDTNIALSYDYLWGNYYPESELELSDEERNPENIQRAMEARGFTLYQRGDIS